MGAKLRRPPTCRPRPSGGPAWWRAAALPERVQELTARLGLDLGEPFEPGGDCSWVAAKEERDRTGVVLKVAWQHAEALHEAEGWRRSAAEGRSRYRVRAPAVPPGGRRTATPTPPRSCSNGAGPGPSCATPRGRAACRRHGPLRSVWAVDLRSTTFRPLSSMADDSVSAPRRGSPPTRKDSRRAGPQGLALSRLSRTGAIEVLLFTDLHAGDVLSGERPRGSSSIPSRMSATRTMTCCSTL